MRPPGLIAAALASLLGAACSETTAYRGTGSLQASGAPGPELASHAVSVLSCDGEPAATPPVAPFAVVSVGERCAMRGAWSNRTVVMSGGDVCSLSFAGKDRAIRITDGSARFEGGQDASYVRVVAGGDDLKSGQHVVYNFAGAATAEKPAQGACDVYTHTTDRPRQPERSGAPLSDKVP